MFLSIKNLVFLRWRYVLVGLVVLLIGGYFYLGGGQKLEGTLVVTRGDFSKEVVISGTVTAAQDVDLGFAASGRIIGVYGRVGQRVGAGTILAETENGDLVAEISQKQAALLQMKANLSLLEVGTRPEEITIAAVSVTNAETDLINAIQNAYTVSDDAIRNRTDSFFTNPRTNPQLSFAVSSMVLETLVEQNRANIESVLMKWALLVGKLTSTNARESAKQSQSYLAEVTTLLADANTALTQGIPGQTTSAETLSSYGTTLATARTNVNAATTALTTSVAVLDSARSTLALRRAGSTSETIAAAAAAVAAAAADVRAAEAKLSATRVAAPFSGTITRMDAKVGEIASPTASAISMQSNGIFEIETYIPEVTIARVVPGNLATTTLDAYGSSVAFPARVITVDPAETVKDGVPTYKTTLRFLKEDPAIRSGMTANVTIVTGILQNAIVIPAGSIGTKGDATYVSVVKNDAIISRTVVTGLSPALGQSEVLSGLVAGDVILLTPVP